MPGLPVNKLFSPAPTLKATRTQLQVPAFSFTPSAWAGYSVKLGSFPLSNASRPVSFALPITAWDPSFVAAIRWVVAPGVAYRFALWNDPNAVLYYPVYNGETIGLNAVLEIWSNSIGNPAALASSVNFDTSWLNPTQDCIFQCGPDVPTVQTLVQVPDVVLPPYSYCNPLCICLTP
jgi:hypothetical protein